VENPEAATLLLACVSVCLCDKGGNCSRNKNKTKRKRATTTSSTHKIAEIFSHRWRPPNNFFFYIFFAKRQQRHKNNNNEEDSKTQFAYEWKRRRATVSLAPLKRMCVCKREKEFGMTVCVCVCVECRKCRCRWPLAGVFVVLLLLRRNVVQ